MECKYCEDTGITEQSNGPDDVQRVYCTCEAGMAYREEKRDREVDDYIAKEQEKNG